MTALGKLIGRILGSPDPWKIVAARTYATLAAQARQPGFYGRMGVPDTVDGRFEMVALHAFLLFSRLKESPERAGHLSQAIYDAMFADFDVSIRELGAGDLGVARRIRFMTEAMAGRFKAYDSGLAGETADLETALRRNVYGTAEPDADNVRSMVDYMLGARTALARQPIDALLRGAVWFPALEPDRLDY